MIKVYVERGSRRVFAGALDWPGWSRGGPDEAAALKALLDYAPRYAKALRGSGLRFRAPARIADFEVVERLKGGAGTDEGWPQAYPAADAARMAGPRSGDPQRYSGPAGGPSTRRSRRPRGTALHADPGGRGRTLERILRHVLQGHSLYLSELGAPFSPAPDASPESRLRAIRPLTLKALRHAAQGKRMSARPGGGKRWSPRYFVRRAAWHVLDHAWEIEDRLAVACRSPYLAASYP